MGRKKKQDSLVQLQRVRTRDKHDEKVFDYQKWREEQERYDETGIADPDILGDETVAPEVMLEIEESKKRVNKLIEKAKQILTERQFQVFELVAVDARSFQSAAKTLSKRLNKPMSKQTVAEIWEAARVKLAKLNV